MRNVCFKKTERIKELSIERMKNIKDALKTKTKFIGQMISLPWWDRKRMNSDVLLSTMIRFRRKFVLRRGRKEKETSGHRERKREVTTQGFEGGGGGGCRVRWW